MRRNFVLIQAIYTHWYRQLNSSTNFFNFCWWRIPLAMTSLPRIGVHPTMREGNQNSKTNLFRVKWIAEYFSAILMSWMIISFSTIEWLNKTCFAYCIHPEESFQRIRNKSYPKISTGLASHHLQRFPALDAAASTQCNFMLLELVLLWHYLNNVWHAFRFSVRSFLMSI